MKIHVKKHLYESKLDNKCPYNFGHKCIAKNIRLLLQLLPDHVLCNLHFHLHLLLTLPCNKTSIFRLKTGKMGEEK